MKKPYRYQEDVVKCSVEYFRDNDRGKIILPCGSGKTLISLWIHEALNSKLTIVLVPSISLIKQTKDNWKSEKSVDFDYLCICSSQDVDEDDDEEYSLDFIEEYSCKVTTNSNVIKKFLLLDKSKNKVIFSTYQSLNKVIEAVKDEDLMFDLAICDEAHRTAGEIFNLKITNFKKIHSNDNIKVKKRLYMTATPRVVNTEYYNINDDDKKNDENICSVSLSRLVKNMTENVFNMDDVKTFGNVIYQMSFQKAIDENILVDYKIVGVGVSDRQIEEYIKSGKVVDKNISYQDIMDNYACNLIMEKYNLKHAITFHSKIKKAENFCERHKQFFKNFDSYCISSKIDSDKRNEIMFNFKNSEKSLISNARCLSEGVDIPNVDMIFYSNIKKSTIDIVQSAGRALRKYKDKNGKEKEFGYIVIPIYYQEKPNNFNKVFDYDSKNVEYEVEGTNKKIQIRKKDLNEMINIIKKIGDEDERIESYINLSFLKFQNKNNKKETEEESEEDKKNSIILENFNDEQIEKAILERIIKRSYKSWTVKFIELKKFIEEKERIPEKSCNMTEENLYEWLEKQKKLFINNELNTYKISKLQSIEKISYLFCSETELYDKLWDYSFKKLKKYLENNSNNDSNSFFNINTSDKNFIKKSYLLRFLDLQNSYYNLNDLEYLKLNAFLNDEVLSNFLSEKKYKGYKKEIIKYKIKLMSFSYNLNKNKYSFILLKNNKYKFIVKKFSKINRIFNKISNIFKEFCKIKNEIDILRKDYIKYNIDNIQEEYILQLFLYNDNYFILKYAKKILNIYNKSYEFLIDIKKTKKIIRANFNKYKNYLEKIELKDSSLKDINNKINYINKELSMLKHIKNTNTKSKYNSYISKNRMDYKNLYKQYKEYCDENFILTLNDYDIKQLLIFESRLLILKSKEEGKLYQYDIKNYKIKNIIKNLELNKNIIIKEHLELTEETKIIKTEYNAEVKLIREKINNYFKKRNIIELNDIITLKKDNGQIFKIKIVDSNSCIDDDITIVNKNTLYGESLIGVALNEIVDIEKKNSIESIEILKIEKAK